MRTMTRRTRQHAELRHLCENGLLEHAVDLAFDHFSEFGPDTDLLATLAAELERRPVPAVVRARFAELAELRER